ncbi:sugar transferase [Streptacidiphilus jiangxiensis]|uniref:Sugar transferase involved in LPS biosynthesis (Colanic, teichoic acid) n=1 Tax=Streptacidiphilus jiangxiensis TaxID=235985 RepID=A0A1H7QP75_STRJI|nr:sugar transferase [Streptacidiphilus jiangxiensis]SEL49776.1 Sugar transferase involved in LPS biosynthesis (colanic, teichoic acid) [Streptacidiphilus jiangxiensis]
MAASTVPEPRLPHRGAATLRPTVRAPAATAGEIRQDTWRRRGVDLVVAFVLLVVLSPFLLLGVLVVELTSRGPAIYRQQRVGRFGEPFTIWKLRTMVADADRAGPAVGGSTDPRITAVGHWLRETRLDELPQLVNLLCGDMTLIGSRPEVERFLRFYTPREREILRTRPGVLGPGALYGAGCTEELCTVADPDAWYAAHQLHPKLALDLAYLADRRLRTDLGLLLRTAAVVLGRTLRTP